MTSLCRECGLEPKLPGQGNAFCSDKCRELAKLKHKPMSSEQRAWRVEYRRLKRRAAGQKERAKTWDLNGNRLCPRCGDYFPLSEWKAGYCFTCKPRQNKDAKLRRVYGITLAQYENMLTAQNGKCAICQKSSERLDVDHCHTTGKIRGLLCVDCNYRLLGLVQDDSERLRRAADYVDRARAMG